MQELLDINSVYYVNEYSLIVLFEQANAKSSMHFICQAVNNRNKMAQ